MLIGGRSEGVWSWCDQLCLGAPSHKVASLDDFAPLGVFACILSWSSYTLRRILYGFLMLHPLMTSHPWMSSHRFCVDPVAPLGVFCMDFLDCILRWLHTLGCLCTYSVLIQLHPYVSFAQISQVVFVEEFTVLCVSWSHAVVRLCVSHVVLTLLSSVVARIQAFRSSRECGWI
jgi:hypothetical protein